MKEIIHNGFSYNYEYDEDENIAAVKRSDGNSYQIKRDGLNVEQLTRLEDDELSERYTTDFEEYCYESEKLKETKNSKSSKLYYNNSLIIIKKYKTVNDNETVVMIQNSVISLFLSMGRK